MRVTQPFRWLLPVLLVGLSAACGEGAGKGAANAANESGQAPVQAASGAATAAVGQAEMGYREAVIASARRMNPKGELTARTAYEALDGGPASQAARDLGGLAQAQMWVDRFELFHDHALLAQCVQDFAASRPAQTNIILENLIAAGHAQRVIRSAENFAPAEFAALRAQLDIGTEAALASMAISALLARGASSEETNPERVGILTMMLMALGTQGECVPSERLTGFLGGQRQ